MSNVMKGHAMFVRICGAMLIVPILVAASAAPACAALVNLEATEDATVEGGGSGDTNFGADDEFFVGNEDATALDKARKSYIQFDTSSLSTVTTASLQLTLEDDPPSYTETINLYGINDGVTGEDTWDESTITWNNAPANDTSSYHELTSDATLLASFTVPAGLLNGDSFTITDPDLISFLNSDTNGAVSFILTASREGSSGDPYNLFNFASQNNATSPGPTLTVGTAVPEPGSLAMMGTAVCLIIGTRRRRKQRTNDAGL